MIRYWIKLLISGDNFIPKKVYIMLKNDADNNITYNGAYQIKCILDSIGLSYIWNDHFFPRYSAIHVNKTKINRYVPADLVRIY